MQRSVAFTPDDTLDWGLPLAGPGLLLDLPSEGRWLQRPALHLEAAPCYRLRLSSGGQPLLWVRVEDGWEGCTFLRRAGSAPWGLPPLSAAEVREVPHAPGTERWWEAWTWRFGRALVESPQTVLHAGRWCLRPLQVIPAQAAASYSTCPRSWGFHERPASPHSLESVLRFESFEVEEWQWAESPEEVRNCGTVLPLRAPSPEDDGRVKRWRKQAREGTLPPALLLYVDILERWLVLDGHDRIHAALLEGVAPPLVGLWPVVEDVPSSTSVSREGAVIAAGHQLRAGATPEAIDKANRTLLRNFADVRRGTVTRAWPIRGGLDAWRAEVLAWRRWSPFPAKAEDWEWFVSE
jgi:hypothetical protein